MASAAQAAPRVVVIAGPTGVGKSSLGLRLCEALDGELVSADSVQVFRRMNVGSNKASAEELARVRHHCIDILEPDEPFGAGEFRRAAFGAIRDVIGRGKVPVVVGGTMMYLNWLVHGFPDAPKRSEETREAVAAVLEPLRSRSDWEAGLALLRERHAERSAAITRNDWYRLSRALEAVWDSAGGAGAAAGDGKGPVFTGARDGSDGEGLDFRCFFLAGGRQRLAGSVERRCGEMIDEGLFEEVRDLLCHEAHALDPSSPVGKAIGYRQTIELLLDARLRGGSREDAAPRFDAYLRDFSAATRRYAQKQFKWFRKERTFLWVWQDFADRDSAFERVMAAVRQDAAAFEAALGAPEQADLRGRSAEHARQMKRYRPSTPLEDSEERYEAALERARACARDLRDRGFAPQGPAAAPSDEGEGGGAPS